MSTYLGFQPTQRPGYFFVSYNTEDAGRITPIVTTLVREDVPLWYDYGIEYGEKWAPQITDKLSKAQGVILFFTKGILAKENSYVRKEYRMAKEFLNKKVYIVMVDRIDPADIPIHMLDWWIDITGEQCISAYDRAWDEPFYNEIKKALGIETQEKKMNLLMENYLQLFSQGRTEEAEQYVSEYLLGRSLQEKALFFAKVAAGKMEGVRIDPKYEEIGWHVFDASPWGQRMTWKELEHRLGDPSCMYGACLQQIEDTLFVAGSRTVFHRGGLGDACVIHLWRGGENIYTVSRQIEVGRMYLYYDPLEDLLYLIYQSDKAVRVDGELEEITYWSTVIVQNPNGEAVVKKFEYLIEA